MGYEKVTQSFPFVQGPDLKTDQRLSSKPSRLENSIFTTGDLNKHAGRKALPSTIDTGGSFTAGDALFVFNNELERINGGTTYGLGVGTNQWVTKSGGSHYGTLAKTQWVRNTATQAQFDWAAVNGVGVLTWIERTGAQQGVHILVFDQASGSIYQTGATTVLTAGNYPRCVVLGANIVVLWIVSSTNRLYSAVINTALPETAPSATIIRTDVYAGCIAFDAIAYNASTAVCVYQSGTGADLIAIGVNASGAVTTSPAATTFAAALTAASQAGLLVQKDTAGNIYVVFGDSVSGSSSFLVISSAFAVVKAKTSIVTTGNWSGGPGHFMAAASYEVTANNLTVVMSNEDNSFAMYAWLGKVVLSSAGIVTAFAEIPSTQGLRIVADCALFDGTPIFGAYNPDLNTTDLQATAWMLDLSGNVIGRGLLDVTGAFAGQNTRTNKPIVSGLTVSMLFSEEGRVAIEVGGGFNVYNASPFGITSLGITKALVTLLPRQQLGQTVYLGGAIPRTYDGLVVVGDNFPLTPVPLNASDNGAGALSAGVYQWRYIWSWLNAKGELSRGPPSVAISTTLAAARQATLSVATMAASTRDILPAGVTVYLEIYRTQANGTVFQRVSTISAPTYNAVAYSGTTNRALVISDNTSDATLASREFLYTTGGILDWEAPPAYSVACTHQGRLIISPSEAPYSFWPSSQWTPGETVRFSSFTVAYVPADTGPLTGLASLDGKLILLTQSAAYATLGDGPDQLGNNPYPPVQRVVGVDAGPIPGSPVAVTPLGIIYQSVKGLTLLDRSLNQAFIGAEVEPYALPPYTLKSILVHARLQQIHFQVDDGSDIPGSQTEQLVPSNGGFRLVFDYMYKQWSVDPKWGAQGACLYQGNYTQVRSDGLVTQETPGLFLDRGSAYSSIVETPWIKLAGLQGYQRLYYVTLLGTYGSPCTLKLEVAYSYAATEPTVPYFDPADTVTLDGEAARAAGAEGFSPGSQFAFRHHLGRKCSAVKFRMTDTNILGDGTGMGLTDLMLEYGIKKGARKLPAAQTA